MRENGLNARIRRKCIPTTNSRHGLAVYENLLSRMFPEMAVRNRMPQAGMLFHADRGVHYCTKSFRETLLFGSPEHEPEG
jgi:transposase InsO family protein